MLNKLSKYRDSLNSAALENISEIFDSFCSFSYGSLQGNAEAAGWKKTNKKPSSQREQPEIWGQAVSSAITSVCAVLTEKPHPVPSTHGRRLAYKAASGAHTQCTQLRVTENIKTSPLRQSSLNERESAGEEQLRTVDGVKGD